MKTIHLPQYFCAQDPLAGLRTLEGQKLLQIYKDGAILNLWRWSSPHNWWLELKNGDQLAWSTDRDSEGYATQPDARSFVRLGKQLTQEGSVPHGRGMHRDGGLPGKETWKFDSELFFVLERNWVRAVACAKNWNDNAGPFSGDLQMLSSLSLAALRLLANQGSLPMSPELLPTLEDLREKGLLHVAPEGHATLRVPRAKLRIPRGKALKIVWLEDGQVAPSTIEAG